MLSILTKLKLWLLVKSYYIFDKFETLRQRNNSFSIKMKRKGLVCMKVAYSKSNSRVWVFSIKEKYKLCTACTQEIFHPHKSLILSNSFLPAAAFLSEKFERWHLPENFNRLLSFWYGCVKINFGKKGTFLDDLFISLTVWIWKIWRHFRSAHAQEV